MWPATSSSGSTGRPSASAIACRVAADGRFAIVKRDLNMNRRRAQTLTAVALSAIVLASCRPKPSATIVPDPALMPLIPADTTILSGIRLTQLKQTPIYARLKQEGKLRQLDEFREKTGIDLNKDIWEVVFASNQKTGVALVRGQFTEGGIAGSGMEPRLERKGIRSFPYKGYTLSGDEGSAVAFLNSSVAIAGPAGSVRSVIDARDGSKGGPPKALLDRLSTIPSSNQVWLISTAPLQGSLPEGMQGPLGGLQKMPIDIREAVLTLDLTTGAKFQADIGSGDAKAAEKLGTAIQAAIGVGRLMTKADQPDMLRFYDGIQVTKHEAQISVAANVPEAVLENLIDKWHP